LPSTPARTKPSLSGLAFFEPAALALSAAVLTRKAAKIDIIKFLVIAEISSGNNFQKKT
jgi:hypothetical protein